MSVEKRFAAEATERILEELRLSGAVKNLHADIVRAIQDEIESKIVGALNVTDVDMEAIGITAREYVDPKFRQELRDVITVARQAGLL